MILHLHLDQSSETASVEAKRLKQRAMRASLVVAVLMLVGKLWAYLITGSTAILSDALESVVHLGATAMAGFSLWYAAQPPDKQHPYGHGKIAYFSSGFEGAMILLAAAFILVEGIEALISGPELHQLGTGLLITAALGFINLILGLFLVRTGRKTNALVLVANGQHVLTDMWTSLGVLVGVGIVYATDVLWLDPVVAIILGLNIMWTAFGLIQTSYRGLMESVSPEETEKVLGALERAKEGGQIRDYHQVRHRRVNDQVWIEAHFILPDNISLEEAHRRATLVESVLDDLFEDDIVQVTSHLEPLTHEHPEEHTHSLTDSLSGDS
ncbi:MAG: cation diffusion facilitator family transporter [Rubricoccaceae bacterium]|nr:cation diffusion facilitator family transporter [Rubricoccaceae bacterium]